MPYLEVEKNNSEKNDEKIEVKVPNLIGLKIEEAEKMVKDIGLKLDYESEATNEENTRIEEQIPKPGIKIKQGNKITEKLK